MARPKTFTEIDDTIDLFPAASHKLVTRIIERAARTELAANRKALKNAVRGSQGAQRFGRAAERFVAKQLGQALVHRGASKNQAPSTRQKAPDTGGRPFHFAHSHVSATPPGPSKTTSTAVGAATTASGRSASRSRSAAHMRYIERPEAVEELTLDASIERNDVETEKRMSAELSDRSEPHNEIVNGRPSANQSYIEDPVKLANGENIMFSFGTIGDTFDQRVSFWERLEENERNSNGRIQDRLIVELPHEATPEARYEMVKTFCSRFEEANLPYWAALHAPGASNDKRNFHAHIVYSTRPSCRMQHPETGEVCWDFEVVETYKTSSRHLRTKHTHRQKRNPDMERVDAIPRLRRHFADVVNDLLVRDDVKDGHGAPVRYDARSYKDMGLDVVPMRSINRIVADKMKAGHLTVLDRDYTRKMIETELHQARGRRDAKLSELDRIRKAIDRLSSGRGRASDIAVDLPKDLRPAPKATLTGRIVKRAGEAMLTARYAAYVHDVMEQSSRATLHRIVEATDPVVAARSRSNTRDDAKRAAMPDPTHLVWLHDEAKAQKASFEAEAKKARRRLALRVGHAANKWAEAVGTKTPMAAMNRPRSTRTPLSLEEAKRALAQPLREPRDPAAEQGHTPPSRAASRAPENGASTEPDRTTKPIPRKVSAAEITTFKKGMADQQSATIKSLRKLRTIASIDDRIKAVEQMIVSQRAGLQVATANAIAAIRAAEAQARTSKSGRADARREVAGDPGVALTNGAAPPPGPAASGTNATDPWNDADRSEGRDRGATTRGRAGDRDADQRRFEFPMFAPQERPNGPDHMTDAMVAAAALPTAASIPSRRAGQASAISDQVKARQSLDPGLAASAEGPLLSNDIGPEPVSAPGRRPDEDEIDEAVVRSPLDPAEKRRKAILARRQTSCER